ncbi:MFS transporter [Methanothermobacter sp. KEPCO-1]|uniref:MFS transporter n=1 Tax=Methanothermobacter sp. KEPCO-1 TaxID=2603820 RepID=UPI002107ADDE|nr:MFS transporter [Methanothermobacter sp. KEPCO-1]
MDTKSRNIILVLLFAGVFMGALDIGIIGPALPAIEKSFHVDPRLASWMFASYILFFMVGTPVMAKLSDRYGRRNIYILDITLFAAGSAITALSPSYPLLILGRSLQGFGAGGIFPVASAFIGDTFPPESRGRALGIIGSVFGFSSIAGPVLAGFILPYGWEWLFLINIPVAAIIVIAGFFILPVTVKDDEGGFDVLGTIILAVLVTSLAIGINQLDTADIPGSITRPIVSLPLLIAIALLPILWRVENSARDPIIQVDLLREREVRIATAISAGNGLSQSAIVFIPSYALLALSLSESMASFSLLPFVMTMALGAPVIGFLLDRVGSKTVMVSGSLILITGCLMMALLSSTLALFILAEVLMGLGLITVIGAPLRYIMLSEAPLNTGPPARPS